MTDYATNKPAPPSWDANAYHGRTLERGASRVLYWIVRAVLQPVFHVYFRLRGIGLASTCRSSGPVIFASNHRSFLDPFVIGTLVRRPVYYVAKKELFLHPVRGRVAEPLGAFPVDRGAGDSGRWTRRAAILERGDCVVIFPEGRARGPGRSGGPRRGVGRLALQTGAPVVPVAVFGTEAVRRGWRIRPHRVRVRCGRALRSRVIQNPTPALAAARDRPDLAVRDAAVGLARRARCPSAQIVGARRARRASAGARSAWVGSVRGRATAEQGGARRASSASSTGRMLRDVYSYAYYRVGNHHDAEDLTEQTFLQAYRHFERALRESDGRPLRPWLIRIAHNLAANLYRDRSRRPQSPLEDSTTLPRRTRPSDWSSGRDELARVLDGVKQLPDDRREALIMRFALGMDNREIARALGRTDGATKVLIHRAISQLEAIVASAARARAERRRRRGLLRRALAPVEPPEDLATRVRSTLQSISDMAAEELEGWELAAMRDPRNWVRPAARGRGRDRCGSRSRAAARMHQRHRARRTNG